MNPSLKKSESEKLFLEAMLAEYKRLTDEMINHSKNMKDIFAVLVGGVATILGFFGLIGIVSYLLIPIFVSSCATLILMEGYGSTIISFYIIEEIECKKWFQQGSPMRYQRMYESHHGSISVFYWVGWFFLSFFLCLGCLIILSSLWSQVSQSIFYQVVYFFGWMLLAFYTICTVLVFRWIRNKLKSIEVLIACESTAKAVSEGQQP